MTDRVTILEDSSSLLKHDPRVAEAIVNPPRAGSRAAAKLSLLARLIKSLTPAINAPPSDPVGYLQRSIPVALFGSNRRGVSLGSLADRTNPHDPILQALFALKKLASSIHDIGERRLHPAGHDDWSPDQAKAMGDPAPRPTRSWVSLGYRIDAKVMLDAASDLSDIETALGSSDPRRQVIIACLGMANAALWQLRHLLDAAGSMLVELRPIEGETGQCAVTFVPLPDEADAEPIVGPQAPPVKLTELQEFMALVEAILDARADEDVGELEVRAAVMAEARSQSPTLYDWATRKHGVGDVHLAVIDLVQRRHATVPEACPASTGTADAEEVL